MKSIIIINGVMGPIGSPIFSYFAERGEHVIWGISRQGRPFTEFLDNNGSIHQKNLVFSVTDYKSEKFTTDIEKFLASFPELPVIFIHAIGEYVTEMAEDGTLHIQNDHDGDGINDNVKRLTYEVPTYFAQALARRKHATVFVQIGSLSDQYRIDIHGSWVRSMDLLKKDLKDLSQDNPDFHPLIVNVSSVLTPKELIERPFVSIQTNADMRYWLPPSEIAYCINEYLKFPEPGLVEKDLFKKWPHISPDHFVIDSYKSRRSKELFGQSIVQEDDLADAAI